MGGPDANTDRLKQSISAARTSEVSLVMGTNISIAVDISNHFNEFFANVGTKLAKIIKPQKGKNIESKPLWRKLDSALAVWDMAPLNRSAQS